MARDERPARIYLDHAATTPLRPEALQAMSPWLAGVPANPSSVHRSGQRARAAVETARERVAAAIGASPAEVVFTSGATEADALAIVGTLAARGPDAALVVSVAEHAAVLRAAEREERAGRRVVRLPVGAAGAPEVSAVAELLASVADPIGLVAVMHTNNETGALADVRELAVLAHERGAAFLCDAVQALGHAPLDVRTLGADLVALSSHKIGGPQGVGALWVRDGTRIEPQALGGSQERGLRAGTHPVAAIVGFGAAADAALRELPSAIRTCRARRDELEARLSRVAGVRRNGEGPRGPKHLNVRVEGVDGEALLLALDDAGVEVSAGSACAAGSVEASHVLTAMGYDPDAARASLRFTVSARTGEDEIRTAADRFEATVGRLRALGPAASAPL